MTTLKQTTIGCLFMVLCTAGCGGGGRDLDTLGDVFIEIGEAYCDRVIDCGFITSGDRDECESDFQAGACSRANCGADFEGDESDVEECVDDVGDIDCAMIQNVPASCLAL